MAHECYWLARGGGSSNVALPDARHTAMTSDVFSPCSSCFPSGALFLFSFHARVRAAAVCVPDGGLVACARRADRVVGRLGVVGGGRWVHVTAATESLRGTGTDIRTSHLPYGNPRCACVSCILGRSPGWRMSSKRIRKDDGNRLAPTRRESVVRAPSNEIAPVACKEEEKEEDDHWA